MDTSNSFEEGQDSLEPKKRSNSQKHMDCNEKEINPDFSKEKSDLLNEAFNN